MSADLVEVFFERELTESEKDRLGRALDASMEEALRFAGLAEQAYLATGYPVPLPPLKFSAGKWLTTLLLLALLLFGVRWCLSQRQADKTQATDGVPGVIQSAPEASSPARAGGVVSEARPGSKAAGSALRTDSKQTTAPSVPSTHSKTVSAPLGKQGEIPSSPRPPSGAPSSVTDQAEADVSASSPSSITTGALLSQPIPVLKVVLHESASLTVDVVSHDGALTKRLASGPYAVGTHRFEWDGLDASGRPVPPGLYKMRVQNGRETVEKWVVPPVTPVSR